MKRIVAMVVFLGSMGSACRPTERHAVAEPMAESRTRANADAAAAPIATPTTALAEATPEPEPAQRAEVERLLVPGDIAVSVVRGSDRAPPLTVFLPGLCSNASAYLQTFPEAARRQGGVVAIEGDQPCGGAGYRSFSWDAGRQHARVEAALAAAGVTEIPRDGLTLVGYSQGAALAEQMVQRWPGRYARIVLIGAPTDPAPRNLERARGLVTMSCDRDVPARMRQAAQATSRVGVPATYVQMAGCSHGNVTDGERVFDAAFDWLRTHERAPDSRAASERIAGILGS
jgi:pimeloyl-ACP methyl ester carboxylesterase